MLLKSICTNLTLKKTKFIAFGCLYFKVHIDLEVKGDRKYILDLVDIANKQIRCGIYYGTLSREELTYIQNVVTAAENKN